MRTLSKTFIPYLSMLIIFCCGIVYLDFVSEDDYASATTIEIKNTNTDLEYQSIWQTESEHQKDEKGAWVTDPQFLAAKTSFNNKKWTSASRKFKVILQRYPNQKELLNYLGLCHLKRKQFNKAIAIFENSLEQDSSYFSTRINLGISYSKIKHESKALNQYKHAIQIKPTSYKPYLNSGILNCKNQLYTKAIKNLNAAISFSSGKAKAKAFCYKGIAQIGLVDTVNAKISLNEAILLYPQFELPRVQLASLITDPVLKKSQLNKIILLNPSSSIAHYQLSEVFKEEQDFEKSEFHIKKALSFNPNDEVLLNALISNYLKQDKNSEAQNMVTQSLNSSDTLPANFFMLAKIESKNQRFKKALYFYDKAIQKSNSAYPEAALNKGIIYKNLKEFDLAIYSYKHALSMRPKYSAAYYNLALSYSGMDSNALAIKNYKNTVKFNPKKYKAWFNLGRLYNATNQHEKAESVLKRALQVKSNYLKAFMELGRTYGHLKKYDQEIKTYNQLLQIQPNYIGAWYNIALVYKKNKQFPEAINAYEKVINLDLNNVKARKNLGNIYAKNNQLEKAILIYESAADIAVNDEEIRFNIGLQQAKLKQEDAAVASYNKALQINQKYNKAYKKLFDYYKRKKLIEKELNLRHQQLIAFPDGKEMYKLARKQHKRKFYNNATASYKAAISQNEKSHWTYYWLGKAYLDNKNYDKALKSFKTSLYLKPKHKFSVYRTAQAFEKTKNFKKAISYYNQLITIDPDFAQEKEISELITTLKSK
mgnify:CR=1 FL=1